MKKCKAILALVLVAALFLTLFAACAKTEAPADDKPAENKPAATDSKEPAAPAESDDEPEEIDPEDIVDIEMYVVQFTGTTTEFERVQDAINAITEKKIGVRVKMELFEFGDYPTKLSLLFSSGEDTDLCYLSFGAAGYAGLYSNNQLKDLTPYLDEYAPELVEVMGSGLYAYSIDGGIWALPPLRAYNSDAYLIMRKDMLEDAGILDQALNCKSWSEIEGIWDIIREKNPLVAPIGGGCACQDALFGTDDFEGTLSYDRLGDANYQVYCDLSGDGKVEPYCERPEVITQYERSVHWAEDGYMWAEAMVSDEFADNLIRQGTVFCEIMPSEVGVDSAKTQACGTQMVSINLKPLAVCSAHMQKFGIAVPQVADEPEAAVKFLNEMYTNPDIINLLTWGEEGVDYVVKNGEACFPDGIESASVGFHSNDFFVGNQYLITPWEGSGADLRTIAKELSDAAPVSPYLGFTFNSNDYQGEIAQLTAVSDQYSKTLSAGGYTEELFAEYKNKLYAAGLEKYLEGFQTQLDAWMATNK